jgi:hypothetical protein
MIGAFIRVGPRSSLLTTRREPLRPRITQKIDSFFRVKPNPARSGWLRGVSLTARRIPGPVSGRRAIFAELLRRRVASGRGFGPGCGDAGRGRVLGTLKSRVLVARQRGIALNYVGTR